MVHRRQDRSRGREVPPPRPRHRSSGKKGQELGQIELMRPMMGWDRKDVFNGNSTTALLHDNGWTLSSPVPPPPSAQKKRKRWGPQVQGKNPHIPAPNPSMLLACSAINLSPNLGGRAGRWGDVYSNKTPPGRGAEFSLWDRKSRSPLCLSLRLLR